ncbi:PEP-CTERM sorting domain-containing protein [Pelomonas sp. Root1444]|uniref:PEP-CTERM sorting domain-containing protein n=1 Tax=Pelomonas sp. Root1444 TaxID=1736464 RepID=UPI000703587D|nr:PEP-CTERM sorting domain-containing protein [Pelomonas sp. Root1444]KQY86425.1 hypothetical protein ASD35_19750 [Pelomonas sp. Root1444]
MKIVTRCVASASLLFGMGSAHATFMPWQEGLFFPDFDEPSAPVAFGLDDSRFYEYAGVFIGNVGKAGDNSDTINFSWPALTRGEQISSSFSVRAAVGGTALSSGQQLQIVIVDAQSSSLIRTINLNAAQPSYTDPAFVFDNRLYRMTVSPLGLAGAESMDYSIDVMLAPVPEPATSMLMAAGIGLFVLARRRQSA